MAIREVEQFLEANDFPEHQVSADATSSIGAIGEPQLASFDRAKGFFGTVIDSHESLRKFGVSFNTSLEKLQRQCSRMQYRAVMNTQFLHQLDEADNQGLARLESFMPIDPNYGIAYFSWNRDDRRTDPDDMAQIKKNIDLIRGIKPRSYLSVISNVLRKGYEVSILTDEERYGVGADETVEQLFQLYNRFGWNKDEVLAMCQNSNNTIGVAKKDGTIVSAGLTERAIVRLRQHQLTMYEVTEAATDRAFANNGLYAAVSCMLLLDLNQRGNADIVFGECNALETGVLVVAASQGRRNAVKTLEQFYSPSIQDKGLLHQQVPIVGSTPRRSPYSTLLPMSLTKAELQFYATRP